jgi:hypothetical protein
MPEMSDQAERLERLSHRLRVAFAAGCASRVLRIYELDYNRENRSPHAAVDVAWKFACGEQIPEQTFSDTLEAAGDRQNRINEVGIVIPDKEFDMEEISSCLEFIFRGVRSKVPARCRSEL